MGTRRGFLKSLFGGAAASVAWATTAKAEPTKELRPNVLLAERDEVWTLRDPDRTKLPVRRIEVQLDFEPAVTWEYPQTAEELVEAGHIQGIKMPDGKLEISGYPAASRMFNAQRRVYPRMTEDELRADYALQQKGHRPLSRAGQLIDVTNKPGMQATLEEVERERSAIIAHPDQDTPFEVIICNRMTNAFIGWDGKRWGGKRPGDPHGVYAVINTPSVIQYAIGVSEFETTSANMLIQAPARALFG
jgi:hypothetical protein